MARKETGACVRALNIRMEGKQGVRKTVSKVLCSFSLAVALTLLAIPVAGQERARVPIRVTLGYCAISPESMAFWVAEERGLFRKYGLDAPLVFLAGNAPLSICLRHRDWNLDCGVFANYAWLFGLTAL